MASDTHLVDASSRIGGQDELPQYIAVHETVIDSRTVLAVEGELDLYTCPIVVEAIDAAAARGAVVLDLRPLTFIDASGVGAILTAHRRLSHGPGLTVVAGPPNVQRVFELCGLLTVLTFVTDAA